MQIKVTLTIADLSSLEARAGIKFSRAVDMHRYAYRDWPHVQPHPVIEANLTEVCLVLFEREGDGWVGYSSPLHRGKFSHEVDTIKDTGDKLKDTLVQFLAERFICPE